MAPMLSVGDLAVQRCQEKTRGGNSYYNKSFVKHLASKLSTSGNKVDWFRCLVCGRYHLGRRY